jgi:hypothetical protein
MKIEIGEKEFNLVYNNRALFKIEKVLDKPIIAIFQDENELSKMHTIYTIIWSGITEDITFDDFCDIADFDTLSKSLPNILKSIGDSFATGSKKK